MSKQVAAEIIVVGAAGGWTSGYAISARYQLMKRRVLSSIGV